MKRVACELNTCKLLQYTAILMAVYLPAGPQLSTGEKPYQIATTCPHPQLHPHTNQQNDNTSNARDILMHLIFFREVTSEAGSSHTADISLLTGWAQSAHLVSCVCASEAQISCFCTAMFPTELLCQHIHVEKPQAEGRTNAYPPPIPACSCVTRPNPRLL